MKTLLKEICNYCNYQQEKLGYDEQNCKLFYFKCWMIISYYRCVEIKEYDRKLYDLSPVPNSTTCFPVNNDCQHAIAPQHGTGCSCQLD